MVHAATGFNELGEEVKYINKRQRKLAKAVTLSAYIREVTSLILGQNTVRLLWISSSPAYQSWDSDTNYSMTISFQILCNSVFSNHIIRCCVVLINGRVAK
jgi:hypothetical protein